MTVPTRRTTRPADRLAPAWSMAVAIAALGATVALAACGGDGADLAGRSFTSTEVRGHELVAGSTVTLTFEEGRISAQAGCNTLGGGATWDGDTVTLGDDTTGMTLAELRS